MKTFAQIIRIDIVRVGKRLLFERFAGKKSKENQKKKEKKREKTDVDFSYILFAHVENSLMKREPGGTQIHIKAHPHVHAEVAKDSKRVERSKRCITIFHFVPKFVVQNSAPPT